MTTEQIQQRRILIADDDDGVRAVLRDLLAGEGYHVSEARSGTEVLTNLAAGNGYHLLLMDVRMPGLDGLEVLERLRKNNSDIGVIMITAHATSSVAIRAMQAGAFDYLLKPFEVDEVLVLVQRFFEHQELASKVKTLESQASDPRERMIGQSPAMQRIYKTIGRVAASDAPVLVTGETGTGKELVANVIHANSSRRNGPMISVNCAALPDTLLESELFGHEKGAFTSAVAQRKGRFELANNGTIFLDEVGELSLTAQKKLLRVLQEGTFERVGGTATIKVDVRVITATNRDLEEEVRKGTFREDLYYRLNVINIHMPPLRERKEDIPLLIEYFLNKYRYTPASPPTRISEEAIAKMMAYDWPGNVRQLENEIRRAVVYAQGKVITSDLLSLEPGRAVVEFDIAQAVRDRVPLEALLRDVERSMLSEALRQCDGDRSAAAERLGLTAAALDKRLKTYGLA
ncbi:sigma-54-dependent transcriptional regulator [Kallotenue papyrolyticum]|uniref:sigma-54-dependent transcriptional regulator n=1 Tax=Kallotenue papyrolyticum TaxID=1325125 RepID=UPI000492B2FF|nr:sigma-54 dependent transcriptional regulator [Kallotenue papyrolyticum]